MAAKKLTPARTQAEIDWPRWRRLAILRAAILPAVDTRDGGRVSPRVLADLLNRLDARNNGGTCWPGVAALAAEMRCSARQVKRAIEALRSLGLLIVERRSRGEGRKTCNHYTIIWSELALLCPGERKKSTDQSASGTDQSASGTDQSASGTIAAGRNPKDDFELRANARGETVRETVREPPPPPPRESEPSAAAEDFRGEPTADGPADWGEVRAALAAAGLERARPLAAEFARRGHAAGDVLAVVAQWRANAARCGMGPGAIADRLRSGAWPAEGVRPAETIAAERAAAEARKREKRAADAAERERIAAARAERAEYRRLDEAHGAALDALDAAAAERLAERVLDAETLARSRMFGLGPRKQYDARRLLLEHLAGAPP